MRNEIQEVSRRFWGAQDDEDRQHLLLKVQRCSLSEELAGRSGKTQAVPRMVLLVKIRRIEVQGDILDPIAKLSG